MSYLSAAALNDIKANPSQVAYYYGLVQSDFKSKFPSGFAGQPEAHWRFAFCNLVAFEGWPYGGSTAFSLTDCLAASSLNCGNAPALSWWLYDYNWPGSGTVADFVGWDYGEFGNHQQILAYTPAANVGMLFDATIGAFVSGCSYDLLVAHYKFPASNICSFFSWDASAKSTISTFNSEVLDAIANGNYYGSNTLFYTRGIDKMLTQPAEGYWRTPGTAIGNLQV